MENSTKEIACVESCLDRKASIYRQAAHFAESALEFARTSEVQKSVCSVDNSFPF